MFHYSGNLITDWGAANQFTTEFAYTYLPCSDGKVQKFFPDLFERYAVTVTAGISSFHDKANGICAVDEMAASLQQVPEGPHVLVLRLKLASFQSHIHRVSYGVDIHVQSTDTSQANQFDLMKAYLTPDAKFSPTKPAPTF
ncbi:hypothetical protein BEK98_28805 [Streptomyces diastatochromogenes]|uniref:Uncharacterized protein n=1 Tax=Streptomyces diastatochromogenes TaxID=42236 RepID=A0A233S7Y9_STRDA|nr:hypothetical protein BEK98_28805 [Streptomyces diastatochromogenes]